MLINVDAIPICGHVSDEFVVAPVTILWVINPPTRVIELSDSGLTRLMRPCIVVIFQVPVKIDT